MSLLTIREQSTASEAGWHVATARGMTPPDRNENQQALTSVASPSYSAEVNSTGQCARSQAGTPPARR